MGFFPVSSLDKLLTMDVKTEQGAAEQEKMPILWLATEVAAACGMHPFRSETDVFGMCVTRYAGPTARAWAAERSLVSPIPGPKPVVDDAAVEDVNDVESLAVAVKAMAAAEDGGGDAGVEGDEGVREKQEQASKRKKEHAVRHAVHQRLGHNREAETLRVWNISKEAEKRGKWYRSRKLRHDIQIGGRMDAITPKGRPIEVKTRMYRLPKQGPPMYDMIQLVVYMVLTDADCGVLIERTLDKSQMRLTRLWWDPEPSLPSGDASPRTATRQRASPYHHHNDDTLKTEQMDIYNMKQIWEDQVCPKLVKASMAVKDIVEQFRGDEEAC